MLLRSRTGRPSGRTDPERFSGLSIIASNPKQRIAVGGASGLAQKGLGQSIPPDYLRHFFLLCARGEGKGKDSSRRTTRCLLSSTRHPRSCSRLSLSSMRRLFFSALVLLSSMHGLPVPMRCMGCTSASLHLCMARARLLHAARALGHQRVAGLHEFPCADARLPCLRGCDPFESPRGCVHECMKNVLESIRHVRACNGRMRAWSYTGQRCRVCAHVMKVFRTLFAAEVPWAMPAT